MIMQEKVDRIAVNRRAENREFRRQQLIDATIKCISKRGMTGVTTAVVATEAGLSQGIVNLHFKSKDNLLTSTLQYLADEYKALFERALDKAGSMAGDRLLALMENDLKPPACDRQKLAVWFAFWGEAKSVPTYRRICQEYDDEYDGVLIRLCQQIIDEGGYEHVTARQSADALSSMTDGLWLDCLLSKKSWDRRSANAAVYSYLQSVFPDHYAPR